jgi:hypothetical protein
VTNRILRGWVAFFAGFLAITLVAKAMGAQAPATEWRVIAFAYAGGKYEHAIDMYSQPFASQADCMAAARLGVERIRATLTPGDGLIATCIQVPVFAVKT